MIYSTILRNAILGILCMLLVQPVLCMDCGEIEENDKLAWNMMLKNRILFFNHDSVCSLALVDTKHNQFIKKTAPARKEYIANILARQKEELGICKNWLTYLGWHRHGSMGACVEVTGFSLVFSCFDLKNEDTIIRKNTRWRSDGECSIDPIIALLPSIPYPFFNYKGEVCCYGIVAIREQGDEWISTIKEFLTTPAGASKSRQCVICFNDSKQTVWDCLHCLLEFPVLLKAILNSAHVSEQDDIKTYHLDGVTLPDNYATRVKNVQGGFLSFDVLPNFLRDAVKARYNMQNNKS